MISCVAIAGFWASSNFWQPPYRSYPYPPTDLEALATRAGISDEDLRVLLAEEIQRRRLERDTPSRG
jgi:hypothetical protein